MEKNALLTHLMNAVNELDDAYVESLRGPDGKEYWALRDLICDALSLVDKAVAYTGENENE